MSREERFGIGAKIDALLLELLETLRKATYANTQRKILLLDTAIITADSVRFFFQIAWESKLLPNNSFETLATHSQE